MILIGKRRPSAARRAVTRYATDWYDDNGAVDLKSLVGQVWSDHYNVPWQIQAAGAGMPNFGIDANGHGTDGTATTSVGFSRMTVNLGDLVNARGGRTYDPGLDVVDLFCVYGSISLTASNHIVGTEKVPSAAGGAYRYDFFERSGGVNHLDAKIYDTLTPEQRTVLTVPAALTEGILAHRFIGGKIGTRYSLDASVPLEYDAMTVFQAQEFLGGAVRFSAGQGNLDDQVNTIRLYNNTVTGGATVQRMRSLVVQRWEG